MITNNQKVSIDCNLLNDASWAILQLEDEFINAEVELKLIANICEEVMEKALIKDAVLQLSLMNAVDRLRTAFVSCEKKASDSRQSFEAIKVRSR